MRPCIRRFVTAVAFIGAITSGSLADAHHSFAAVYVDNEIATIEGTVVQFLFRNPHSVIQVSVRQPNGGELRYEVEWRGAAQLMQQGVTRMTLHVGDRLVLSGSPSRNPQDRWLRLARLERPKDGFTWRQVLDQ